MASRSDILLEYWSDQRAQARHAETQRATLANLILLIAAGALGFTAQQGLKNTTLPVTVLLIVLGIFGALVSAKYHERYDLHIAQAVEFSRQLAALDLLTDYEVLLQPTRAAHDKQSGPVGVIRLYWLWISLHLLVALAGCSLTLVIIA